jgi:hypothetical protein
MPTPSRLRALRYRIKEFIARDFSGGPNVRDAPSELAANEDIDAWNVQFDERGGVGARLGYVKRNGSAYGGGLVQNVWYSTTVQSEIVQAGSSLYLGTNTTARKTFSTGARAGFADFAGFVCAYHPVDGLFTSTDGITWNVAGNKGTVTVTIATPGVFTLNNHGLIAGDIVYLETTGALPTGLTADTSYYVISTGLTANNFELSTTSGGAAINTTGSQSGVHTLFRAKPAAGNALIPWQNKLFLAGQGTSQIQWSAPGDPSNFPATSFNPIREKDNEPVVALAGASGIDINGRQGFLAFKRRSTYRVFNAATGEYSTVDSTIGAASALSVQSVGQQTYTLCEHGIFSTDGLRPMTEWSVRFLPLWDFSQINYANLDLFCAGRRGNRVEFSLCRAGSSANDLSLELIPAQGSLAPGSHAMSCYAEYGLNTEVLIGGSPTVTGQVYNLYSGGTDDGTAIASRFQTRWYEPSAGFQTQLWQLRLQMRGAFTLSVRKDFAQYDYLSQSVTTTGGSPLWDSGLHWDTGVLWGTPGDQATVPLFGFGVSRQFAVRITASTTSTNAGERLFGQGSPETQGAWALYGINALYMPLGWA